MKSTSYRAQYVLRASCLNPSVATRRLRSSMAAIAVARWHGDDAVILAMPADHVIEDRPAFEEAVEHAKALACSGLVCNVRHPADAS